MLYEICQKLRKKAPDQMCETKFLQICSFSNILTSLRSLNLSFPLLFYAISTAIPKFPSTLSRCIATMIPRIILIITLIRRISTLIPRISTLIPRISTLIPRISTLIPRISTLIPRICFATLALPPLFSGFPSFRSPIPHFGFYR